MQETWAAMDVLCAASGQACMRFEAEGLAGQLVQELGPLTCAASGQACMTTGPVFCAASGQACLRLGPLGRVLCYQQTGLTARPEFLLPVGRLA